MLDPRRADLITLWQAGIAAVQGEATVRASLESDTPFNPDLIIAVGKAAGSMALGALHASLVNPPTLVVAPRSQVEPEMQALNNVTEIESSHPLPDQASLDAGRAVLDAVRSQSGDSRLLLLISGGASALVEELIDDCDLARLQALSSEWLAGGLAIADINAGRVQLSRIKGGRLLQEFAGTAIRVYAISDVEGDDIAVIGSGIGDGSLACCSYESQIVASNDTARAAAATAAINMGYPIQLNEETLYGDVSDVAARIARALMGGEPGVFIWGGEPVVRLPKNPGVGGRNQSLALAIAVEIEGRDEIGLIAAGTDGIDGNSTAAGAIVDGLTIEDSADARQYLDAADAGSWFKSREATFTIGPTDTNVMDLVVAIVGVRRRA